MPGLALLIETKELLAPLVLITGGLLVGLVFEKLVMKKLKDVVSGTKFRGDDIVIDSIKGITTLWFGIAGVYLAVVKLPLDGALSDLLKKVLMVALISSAALVLARIAAGLIRLYTDRVQGLPSSSLLTNLARMTILIVGALIILQSLGVAIAPVMAALGVGGLAVALAASGDALQPVLRRPYHRLPPTPTGRLREARLG